MFKNNPAPKMDTVKRCFFGVLVLSCVALPVTAVFFGSHETLSTSIGTLTFSLLLFSWQFTAKWMIKEKPPAWIPFAIIFRYALIGGLFYAIIQSQVVMWGWFIFGSVLVILAIAMTSIIEQFIKR
ncbi:MAG: hypothetical protein CSA81_02850 [Acidobacteria bacterium]|nr:MAG: hypothetical protein CSA81_02850 [Acidobacteriota bacterium]PIE89211.1 MAG: hypothetical protein CR997_12230 [Acidobacteriota bacterium]